MLTSHSKSTQPALEGGRRPPEGEGIRQEEAKTIPGNCPGAKWNTAHVGTESVQFGCRHSRESQKVMAREIRQESDDEAHYRLS